MIGPLIGLVVVHAMVAWLQRRERQQRQHEETLRRIHQAQAEWELSEPQEPPK
jgi:hypothetical protein